MSCRKCGFVAKCPNCNVSLTYHKFSDRLKCHYCGYERENYNICPQCDSKYIRYFGGGTQKVEEEIKKIFPEISTIRMDVDTTSKMNSHEEILDRFEKEKIDVLVGTQMVTKGLDFDNVTLVGVISADVMLNVQDYRSGERTFDLIEQVTGRAGRAEKEGRAVIQTYSPEHYAVKLSKDHNYQEFYQKYGHKYIVIKNKNVLGTYDTEVNAIETTIQKYPLGTFIVQECNGDESGYTNYISSWQLISI